MRKEKFDQMIKSRTKAYFDSVSVNNEIIPEPERCYSFISERLLKIEGGRLLDIGCGTGRMLKRVWDDHGEKFALHGCDLSDESVQAAGKLCSTATVIAADVESLPYCDGEFDVLLCMHSFHHYPQPKKALKEMYRVLRVGGILYLVENDYPTLRRIRLNISFLRHQHPEGDVRMYSPKHLCRLLRGAGFVAEQSVHIADHSMLLVCKK